MTRANENDFVIDQISTILEKNPDEKTMKGLKIVVLADISKSLAIIADAVTEGGEKS